MSLAAIPIGVMITSMYTPHPSFAKPDDENVKVWRYMDFTKLFSLIDSDCLYFSRADKLGDPFEGSWPKSNVAARECVQSDLPPGMEAIFEFDKQRALQLYAEMPKYTAINCWHVNEHESVAMWSQYLKSDAGIAIQSTYAKLAIRLRLQKNFTLGR